MRLDQRALDPCAIPVRLKSSLEEGNDAPTLDSNIIG